mmetsp:Transcript_106612/g.299547  ORF Transcript_106612/g.299547 Transcript_106612/m.299547 type:complete len:452 (-) Transcript_106612:105-1460(-)
MHDAAMQPLLKSLSPYSVLGGGSGQVQGSCSSTGPGGGGQGCQIGQPGRLPLTARSNSSSLNLNETPRTAGGGYTARSAGGGERGTPRDPQRMALGERRSARDRESVEAICAGIGGAPSVVTGSGALSPQHTARSAALSSEPWSTTPSSKSDALSSRSRSDSLHGYSVPLDDFAPSIGQAGLPFGGSRCFPIGDGLSLRSSTFVCPPASDLDSAKYSVDLMRNLEVMRFVIMKENSKLKDLLKQLQINVAELRDHALRFQRGGRSIEWLIEDARELCELSRADPDARFCERQSFRLLDHPGVDFTLSFYPIAGAGASADPAQELPPSPLATSACLASGNDLCELVLDVVGPTCDGRKLRLGLSIDVEVSKVCAAGEVGCAKTAAFTRTMINGAGQARCTKAWPSVASLPNGGTQLHGHRPATKVFCRLEVEDLTWGPGKLSLRTSNSGGDG